MFSNRSRWSFVALAAVGLGSLVLGGCVYHHDQGGGWEHRGGHYGGYGGHHGGHHHGGHHR